MRASTLTRLNLVVKGLGYPSMERWLHMNYVGKQYSMKKCGELLGISNKTVKDLLTYYRIPVKLARYQTGISGGVGMTVLGWKHLSVRELADRLNISRSKAWRLKKKHTSSVEPSDQATQVDPPSDPSERLSE